MNPGLLTSIAFRPPFSWYSVERGPATWPPVPNSKPPKAPLTRFMEPGRARACPAELRGCGAALVVRTNSGLTCPHAHRVLGGGANGDWLLPPRGGGRHKNPPRLRHVPGARRGPERPTVPVPAPGHRLRDPHPRPPRSLWDDPPPGAGGLPGAGDLYSAHRGHRPPDPARRGSLAGGRGGAGGPAGTQAGGGTAPAPVRRSWGQVFTFDFWRDTMRLTVE